MRTLVYLVLSVSLFGTTLVQAAPVKAVSRIEREKATLDGTVSNAYSEVRKDLLQNLGGILEASPFIKHASQISTQETHTPLAQGSVNNLVKGDRTLLVKGVDKKLLPESLFAVTQTETLCNVTKDCSATLELKITGPIANYRPDFEFQNGSSLNHTFEIFIRAYPVDSGNLGGPTKVSIQLNILSRGYMEYLKSLKLADKTVTEKDIQRGFLLWARHAFNRIGQ